MRGFLMILTIILLSVSILTLGVVGYAGMKDYISFQQEELSHQEQVDKNKAIDECMKVSSVTSNDGSSQRNEPALYIYKLCIEDKGYTTSHKAE